MKKQLLTALLLTTCMTTFTEIYASDDGAQPVVAAAAPAPQTRAAHLAAIRARAQNRQTEVEQKTANIRGHAATVANTRQNIARHTANLEEGLTAIDSKMDPLATLAGQGETAIARHAGVLTTIKNDTERLATEAQRITATLDQTIEDKTRALETAIRAGDSDIEARQRELRDLSAVHASITGQIRSLMDAVDTINHLLDPTAE